MGNLYHYCSEDTFKKIISNICKSRDTKERVFAFELIEQTLTDIFKEKKVDINLTEDFWYDDNIKNHLEYIVSEIMYYHGSPSLVACFCEDGDLSGAWREYADQTRGLSIGFDHSQLGKGKATYIWKRFFMMKVNKLR